jgi:two-component system cell cycle response regulator DivK
MHLLHNGSAPKRILIVEDNEIDLTLLRDILVLHGYETLQTRHGLEAINLASTNVPDLILMDIRLPDVSGLEVTRRLKDDDRSKRIPIIAVTAFAMECHKREALDSGCDAYLSKPITIFGFLRTVESFLSPLPISSSPALLR